jgi:hypothetical protein
MSTKRQNTDHATADTSMRTAQRFALASVTGSAAATPLLTATAFGHAPSVAAVAVAAAVLVAVITIQVIGPQLATALWLVAYSRMLNAVVRKGIAYAKDTDDIHRLMSDLCETQARISAMCNPDISCRHTKIRPAGSAAPTVGPQGQP